MQLIADSGSTKTAWCLLEDDGTARRIEDTIGLNPHYIDAKGIIEKLKTSLLEEVRVLLPSIRAVHFYGAGCSTPIDVAVVTEALEVCFPNSTVAVEHDLLAAARALCQREPGLVAILGTGSNSCYYDGEKIADNIHALGFMLGDEGGGANLGRLLIRSYFYREMPKDLRQIFYDTYQLTKEELFQNVYHKPLPNRYVAGFAKFATKNRSHAYIKGLINENFDKFITQHLLKYEQCKSLPIHFIGSIGIVFEEELRKALSSTGLEAGNLIKNPIEGLIRFHHPVV